MIDWVTSFAIVMGTASERSALWVMACCGESVFSTTQGGQLAGCGLALCVRPLVILRGHVPQRTLAELHSDYACAAFGRWVKCVGIRNPAFTVAKRNARVHGLKLAKFLVVRLFWFVGHRVITQFLECCITRRQSRGMLVQPFRPSIQIRLGKLASYASGVTNTLCIHSSQAACSAARASSSVIVDSGSTAVHANSSPASHPKDRAVQPCAALG